MPVWSDTRSCVTLIILESLAEQPWPHTPLLSSDVLVKSKNVPKLFLNSS